MNSPASPARRRLLKRLALGVSLAPAAADLWRAALAASPAPPLISVDSPEAKAVHYVEDASDAQGATPGNRCGNCGLYQGVSGATQGPCQLFPGKDVKQAGWCRSWAPQM
jgi:hypothetical protein